MSNHAFAIQIHEYGGPEKMRYESMAVAPPGRGEVQIRQHAVGVNYLDTYHRRGVFPLPVLPGVLGVEGAGEILALGEGVTSFAVGDRVAYAARPIGSYATIRNLPTRSLLHLPDQVSFEQAAAVTLQGLTAHMLVNKVTKLKHNDSVLIHAAAGGLGSLLVQWVKHLGCRVIGTVGSDTKAEHAKNFGCDEVIFYKKEPFVDRVKDLTNGEGVDVVFEGLGGQVFHDSLRVLKPFGQLVNLGQVADGLPTVNLSELGPVASLTVSVPGVFAYINTHPDLQSAADSLFDMVAGNSLRVHIGQAFSLADAAQAHRALQGRETMGSLILIP